MSTSIKICIAHQKFTTGFAQNAKIKKYVCISVIIFPFICTFLGVHLDLANPKFPKFHIAHEKCEQSYVAVLTPVCGPEGVDHPKSRNHPRNCTHSSGRLFHKCVRPKWVQNYEENNDFFSHKLEPPKCALYPRMTHMWIHNYANYYDISIQISCKCHVLCKFQSS